jgi:multidrug efflux pump subunit AcrA (membrane-fusion protein)
MKSVRLLAVKKLFCLLVLTGLLTACELPAKSLPTPTPEASVLPTTRLSSGVVASARVVPAQVSELSFLLSGRVKEVLVQPGDRVQAGQILAVLEAPALDSSVTQAEAALRAAQIEYEYYLVPRRQPPVFLKKPWKGPTAGPLEPPERKALAAAQLAAAQAALESARASATQAVLVAPFDGVVTKVTKTAGEVAGVAQPVIVLASLDHLQVETTDLGERDVARIRPGQMAQVYIEALDEQFPARVVKIVPRAGRDGSDVVFRVILTFESQPNGLLWGMNAEVTITVEGSS